MLNIQPLLYITAVSLYKCIVFCVHCKLNFTNCVPNAVYFLTVQLGNSNYMCAVETEHNRAHVLSPLNQNTTEPMFSVLWNVFLKLCKIWPEIFGYITGFRLQVLQKPEVYKTFVLVLHVWTDKANWWMKNTKDFIRAADQLYLESCTRGLGWVLLVISWGG